MTNIRPIETATYIPNLLHAPRGLAEDYLLTASETILPCSPSPAATLGLLKLTLLVHHLFKSAVTQD